MSSTNSTARSTRSGFTAITHTTVSDAYADHTDITFFPSFEEQQEHVRQDRERQNTLAERAYFAEKQREQAFVGQELPGAAIRQQYDEDDADLQERLRDKVEELRRR